MFITQSCILCWMVTNKCQVDQGDTSWLFRPNWLNWAKQRTFYVYSDNMMDETG